jgi:uncharacterized membrane protein
VSKPRERWVESGTDLERTVFFSDAVFAIAITLLILDIRVPEMPKEQISAQLPSLAFGLWPRVLSFVVSFLVIGSFWMSHHRMFHYIKRYDGRLLWINFFFLMSIVFLPFPTSVLSAGNEPQQFAGAFYASSVSIAGLLGACIWWFATSRRRLVEDDIYPRLISLFLLRALATPLIFGFSIGIPFISVLAAEYSWALVAVARWTLPHVLFRGEIET